MEQQKKGVVFDFNGTLFFDGPYHKLAWNQVSLALRQKPITDEELNFSVHGKTNVQIVQWLSGNADPDFLEAWSQKKEAIYRDLVRQDFPVSLTPGAEALFDALKAEQIPFTIASASIKENIDFFVETFGLDKWMDPASIVYDDGTHEGKESMFRQAAERLDVPVESLVVFEDSATGIRQAKKAGVQDIRLIDSGGIESAVADLVSSSSKDFVGTVV